MSSLTNASCFNFNRGETEQCSQVLTSVGKKIEIENLRNLLTYLFTCAEDGGRKLPIKMLSCPRRQ